MIDAALEVHDNAAAGRIEATVSGQTGYAEYRLAPGTITFTHTRVPENLRGHGIGTRLIETGLALARARGLQVLPVCPFFRAYMRAHADTQDLLGVAGQKLLAEPG
jgi:predicted GNAT family acetyltransferase